MKKQIILISRIYYLSPEEFLKYANEDKESVFIENEETRLLILKGSLFYKTEIEIDGEIGYKDGARKILKTALSEGVQKDHRTIIAYHDTDEHFEDFKFAIEQEKWSKVENIKEYSGDGNEANNPLYRDILNPLGRAIKSNKKDAQSKLIDKLWSFFSHNPELEAKLILLQSVLNGETTGKTCLSEPIKSFQAKFDEFAVVEEVKNGDVFSKNDEYQKAYAGLREAFNVKIQPNI